MQAFEVKVSYARLVARKTRDLSQEQADYVDERVVESADGRISWSRFETLVEGAVKAADPDAAAEREEAERRRQFATPTASTEDGMRGFYVRGPFATIARLDATVAYFAEALLHLGDTGTLDERRVKAILILANPVHAVNLLKAYRRWLTTHATGEKEETPPEVDWSKLRPRSPSAPPFYGGPESDGIARIEGHGPLTQAWVRRHLGPHVRHSPGPRHRGPGPGRRGSRPTSTGRARTPADTFPFANSLSRSQPIDHTIAFKHGAAAKGAGQSRVGNYGKLTVIHHRIKTFTGWEVQQPFPGNYVWRDPFGALYLVDHTGTRRLEHPDAA